MYKKGSGDDGGLAWRGGQRYVFYDGDSGSVRYTYSKSEGLTFSKVFTSVHFDSVFSDLKGDMYRLTTRAGASRSSSSVSRSSAFSYLQCLYPDGRVKGHARLSSSQRMGSAYLVYAGYGFVAFLDRSNRWKLLKLNRCGGTVSVMNLGRNSGSMQRHYPCERGRQNGVLEKSGKRFSIVYPGGSGRFYRKSIPSGSSSVAFSLGTTYHRDTCSLTLDVRRRQFYFHTESAGGVHEPRSVCVPDGGIAHKEIVLVYIRSVKPRLPIANRLARHVYRHVYRHAHVLLRRF